MASPVLRPDFELVFNGAPGNYLLLDPDLTIVGVTTAYLAATMTTREAIVGRGLFEAFPDNPNDPAADGVRNLRASLGRVLASKKPDRMTVQKYDIRRPEGGFEVRYWSPLNAPVLGPDGNVRYIVHWVEDVTEFVQLKREMERGSAELDQDRREAAGRIDADGFFQKEALEAHQKVSESERRYRFLADALPHLIWTADGDGRLDYCNERWATFTGLPIERLYGDGWHETLHPDDRARVIAAWTDAVHQCSERFQHEHRMRFENGSWRWVLMTALPDRDAEGTIRRWFGTTTDIHERYQADEQMRQAQKLQSVGQLAGGMAHEVNNMMSAVLGFGELVLEKLGRSHPQRRDVEEMVRAGVRASEVTRQLLAFSRQQVLKPVVLDVNAVVSELIPTLERLIGSDRRLEVVSASTAPRVRVDRSQIEQVLINLAANARDATVTDGLILIKTEVVEIDHAALAARQETEIEPGHFVRLTVQDNGSGMAADVKARVFEPFFTTKVVGKGTGLGLSMVYGIVKQSGGFVGVESAPGVGTLLSVHLPAIVAPVTEQPAAAASPVGRGEVVLVVEDEPIVRSLVQRVLEANGYRVYQAPNGTVALDFVSSGAGPIDLVLTDVVMPRMSGRELADKIAIRYPDLPVLFMSGYSGDEMMQRGMVLAGFPFVQKPITSEKLLAAVRARLDARDRARQAGAPKQ